MQKVDGLTFGAALEFKPGGKHAMLFGLDPALKPGAKVPLTFTFQTAPPVTVRATVHAPGGGGGHANH
jgi:copper(I)-binding protein